MTPLEALEKIVKHCENDFIRNMLYGYEQEIKIVKTALKDYEEYEEIRKSYSLTFPQLRNACLVFVQMDKDISTIHKLKEYEKKAKAFDLIYPISFEIEYDEKNDDWFLYITIFTQDGKYRELVHSGDGKEEYELLKEMLK